MKKKTYQVRITQSDQDTFASVARDLGFVISRRGANYGKSSSPQFIASLAAAYRADPAALLAALRSVGVGVSAPPALGVYPVILPPKAIIPSPP